MIEIVRATQKHVEQLAELMAEAFSYTRTIEDIKKYWIAPDFCKYYVAVEGATLVGYVMVQQDDELEGIVIAEIGVSPRRRRQGIATKLINHIKTRPVHLMVSNHNIKARILYNKLGFKPGGRTDKLDQGYGIWMERAA